jgi:hypothetical protein
VGRDYARALARRLAPEINRALASLTKRPEIPVPIWGTAGLWWGEPADLETNLLLENDERNLQETRFRTVIYRYASRQLVIVRSSGTVRELVWDLGAVPNAFDPHGALDYGTVATRIVALHTYTTAPSRLP